MRYILFLLIFLIWSCGRKAPPPGKPDIDPPEITIITPASGDTLQDTVEIKLDLKDQNKISMVELWVDGEKTVVDSLEPFTLFWDTTIFPDTLHTLQIKATDSWENWGSSSSLSIFTKNVNP